MIETNTKNNPSTMNRQEFIDLIESNNIKFTPAQKEFVDNVLKGWSYTIENPHYVSGGTYVWVDNFGSHQYGRSLYRMIGNVSHKVYMKTGVKVNFHEWLKIK